MSALTSRVEAWRAGGRQVSFRDRSIFVRTRPGEGLPVVFLHGFPSSSYDWRLLWQRLPEGGPLLAFDFLGFGLSEKPREHDYTLRWQADLAESLVSGELGGRAFVVAHDYGTSVANELMARDLAGEGRIELAGVLLFNGSMIQDLATPTLAQKMLRSRAGPLVARLSSRRFFDTQFGSIFSSAHPVSREELDDQWALLTHAGGRTLGHRLIRYMDERMRLAARWHGAIRDWRGDLSIAWAMADPVANVEILKRLQAIRPGVPVTELHGVGHYPQLEDPARCARLVAEAAARA